MLRGVSLYSLSAILLLACSPPPNYTNDAGGCVASTIDSASTTLVVRLAYSGGQPIRYALLQRKGTLTLDELIRSVESRDAGPQLRYYTTPEASPAVTFGALPLDFGHAALIGRDGTSLFEGSIVWNGEGEVMETGLAWTLAEASECSSEPTRDRLTASVRHTFDFRSFTELPSSDMEDAIAAASKCRQVTSFLANRSATASMVALYPPRVGRFDPTIAEWVLVVEAN